MFARVALLSVLASSLVLGCAAEVPEEEEGVVSSDVAEASKALPAPGDTAGHLYFGTPEHAYLTDDDYLSEWVFNSKGGNEFKTSVIAYGDDGFADATKQVGFKLYGLSRTRTGKLVWTLVGKVDGPEGQAVLKYTGANDRTYMLTAAAGQFPQSVQVALSCAGGTENCALRQQPGQTCSKKLACDGGLFCNYPAPTCGANGAVGSCVKPSPICPKFYSPVCGCDGKTYGNGCEAASSSVSIAKTGACNAPACDPSVYTSFDPSNGHLAESPWADGEQTWFYSFTADGTFTSSFAPPCTRIEPYCRVRFEQKTGKFFIIGSTVQLNYDDGEVSKLAAEWNCKETKRFTGVDHGELRTLTATTISY